MRVLDGAVTLLDGVAGVEAQTETVWRQANSYNIPRIIMVNKMDRIGASFAKSVASVWARLSGWGVPLVLHLPVFTNLKGNQFCQVPAFGSSKPVENTHDGSFDSIADVLALEILDWNADSKTGSIVTRNPINDPTILAHARLARENVVEALSEVDEELMELFGSSDYISTEDIKSAIRRQTLKGSVVPLFCGASFKNIGVQPILDAVIDYLPSPIDSAVPVAKDNRGYNVPIVLNDSKMCALAFKVVYDHQRGPLVFVRVYSGQLQSRSVLQIVNFEKKAEKERASKLLEMYADDYEEIPRIDAGNIGVVVGLKHVKTGDTLLAMNDSRNIKLHNIAIPPSVFVRSVQVESQTQEKELEFALMNLLREDPSLSISFNEETGQTLISGMGELHLEIAGERLQDVYNAKCTLGKVEIAYRETCITNGIPISKVISYSKELFGKELKCDITLEFNSIEGDSVVDTRISAESIMQGLSDVPQELGVSGFPTLHEIRSALHLAVSSALSRGPLEGYPVSQVSVKCTRLGLYSSPLTNLAAIRSAANACVKQALNSAEVKMLEPIMSIDITVPSQYVGNVSRDLSGQRRGLIHSVEAIDGERTLINAEAPLSNLIGYASSIRGLTHGNAEFVQSFSSWRVKRT